MSILIVDDSKSLRLLLKAFLKKAGYTDLLIAESADQAFQILGIPDPSGPPPEVKLILMDLNMPGMNGIETCRRIKSVGAYKDVPILMVTSEADKSKLQQAFDAGAEDHVNKPMDRDDFLAKISKYMKDES